MPFSIGNLKVTGKSLKDQQVVMLGAGSTGIGVADGLRAAMQSEGLSEQEVRSHFWVPDMAHVFPVLLKNRRE